MPLAKSKLSRILYVLKDVRQIATMETSSFRVSPDRPFAPENGAWTELVRETTRIWRESWILGPLDEVITELEGELEG